MIDRAGQEPELTAPEKRAKLAELLREKASQGRQEFPLSYGQRTLWFLYQMEPQSAAFNLSFAARLRSTVDVPALRRVLQTLVERHAVSRTLFAARDGVPFQRVNKQLDCPFEVVDASGWSEEALNERLVEEVHCPFDLERGPLFRRYLFTQSAQEHVLLLTLHHIIGDFWSLALLMHEVKALYEAECAGKTLSLPPVAQPYQDFVAWQAAMLDSPEGQRHWEYWREQLGRELPVLILPTDHPRPTPQSHNGAVKTISVDDHVSRRLKELAKAEGATIFMVLVAAYQALLQRYTGQDDIIVGTPVSGRNHAGFEGVAGYFVNMVALRADLAADPTFRGLVGQTRRTVLAALEHQDYPYALLIERLKVERDSSRPPLFQTAFVWEKSHRMSHKGVSPFTNTQSTARVSLGQLEAEFINVEQRTSHFDLSLVLEESGESLFTTVQYNTDLFDAATVDRVLEHWQRLLAEIADDPDRRLSELPLLSASERRTVLVDWNATDVKRADRTVLEQFEEQADRMRDAIAVDFDGQALTYRELGSRANRLARRLVGLGVRPESTVGLCVDRSIDLVIGLVAILKARGVYVPLDPKLPRERLAYLIDDSGLALLVAHERCLTSIDAPPSLPVVCLDRDADAWMAESDLNLDIAVSSQDAAYVIYTSGSTGEPKGVVVEHRSLANLAAAQARAFGVAPGWRVLQLVSPSFDVSIGTIFTTLVAGGTLCLARAEDLLDGAGLVRLLRERAITMVEMPASLLACLPEAELPDLRAIVSGGDVCSASLVERWGKGRRFFNAYGPTEATVTAALHECVLGRAAPPIGRPIDNVRAYVLDRRKQPVPIGVRGELYLGGACPARGYLGQRELTAERFIADPFARNPSDRVYRTGDLARWLPDGLLEFVGRVDEQVKVRGFRIEPAEIEAALGLHPAVEQAAVIACNDASGGKRLVAYVVLRGDATTATAELRGFLEAKLPAYMVPSAILQVATMPRTASGKLDRRALPSADGHIESSAVYVAPRNDREAALAEIVAKVLGRERVGIHDNFFELGGHSLAVIEVLSRVRDSLDVELPLQSLFQTPTIAGLSQAIDGASTTSSDLIDARSVADLVSEVSLDFEIAPRSFDLSRAADPRKIFVTGATGFLGAFLLDELQRETTADLYCLVRSRTVADGKDKLRANLEAYSLWSEKLDRRIIAMQGDLSQPRLGLSSEQFHSLAGSIDVIYHNGALVNFLHSYEAHKDANVAGTREVLRLANDGGGIPIHYVSTPSVFATVDDASDHLVFEQDSLDHGGVLYGGYAQSKWVAEKLVAHARSKGLPVAIYRPGRIAGHSRSGAWNTHDLTCSLLRTFVQFGSVPKFAAPIDLTPVDYVSRAIVALSRSADAFGKAFHLVHPDAPRWATLIEGLRAFGYPVREMPQEEWFAEFMTRAGNDSQQALLAALVLSAASSDTKAAGPALPRQARMPQFDCRNTLDGLAATDIRCPAIDLDVMATYLSYLVGVGFLEAPPHEREPSVICAQTALASERA